MDGRVYFQYVQILQFQGTKQINLAEASFFGVQESRKKEPD